MKRSEENNRTFSEILRGIEKQLLPLIDYPDDYARPVVQNILKDVAEAKHTLIGLRRFTLILSVITFTSIILSVYLFSINKKSEREVVKINSIDSIADAILKNNKKNSYSYRVDQQGKIISYEKLSKSNDSLKVENRALNDSIEDLRLRLKLFSNTRYKIEKKKISGNIVYTLKYEESEDSKKLMEYIRKSIKDTDAFIKNREKKDSNTIYESP